MDKIIVILFMIVIMNSINCGFEKKIFNCNSNKNLDLLIQDVLNKEYIYVETDPKNFNKVRYLLVNDFVQPNKSFISFDSLTVNTIDKDSIKNKNASIITFYKSKINSDTTSVFVKVDYLSMGIITTKISSFNYLFDTINCKWILKDSSSIFFY